MKKHYKDYQLLIILLLISFFSVYFMPAMLNRLVFLGILFAAYRTRYDYVYLVWFFIINDAPGRLFSAGAFEAARIPLYPVMAGISVSFQDLFILMYIVKVANLKKPPKFIFKKEFSWLIGYAFWVLGYSFLLGVSFENLIITFRIFLPWGLIFVVPVFFSNRDVLVRATLLIFPVVLFALFSQIYSYITENYWDDALRGIQSEYITVRKGEASRSYSAVYITLFSIIQACYFFPGRKKEINRNYLAMIIFLGVFSIFLTATRGWIIAMIVFLLCILAVFGFLLRYLRLAVVAVVVLLVTMNQYPIVQTQIDATLERVSTLEALAEGDLTARNTLRRLDALPKRVMQKFWESPIIGYGFSKDYYRFRDGHIGHHNLLLHVGMIGYALLTGLYAYLLLKIYHYSSRFQKTKDPSIRIYIFGMIAVFVIHSSSQQLWGIDLVFDHLQKVVYWSFFFAAVNGVILYPQRAG